MSRWTVEQVLALAPDASSASAGEGLASARKWSGVGRSERALWGLCQGSGKNPYQTRVDLAGPAFKCSCPSRKFPCKHGLGLMLVFARDASACPQAAEPGWVSEWLESRQDRAEKKAEKAQAEAAKPVDEAAQAKRRAQREARVQDGIAECRLWLEDLVRRGLASARAEADWEKPAARMVDAQAPGLAVAIRRLGEALASGDGWHLRATDQIGRLHLLLAAAERLESLPAALAGDVRVALGWNQGKEEAIAGEVVKDRWSVVGQVVEEEQRLRSRRTWLLGRESGRRALVLDFAAGTAAFEPGPPLGMAFEGEVAFYPSTLPMRALIKVPGEPGPISGVMSVDRNIEEGLRRYAEAIGANPWTLRTLMVLEQAQFGLAGGEWFVADREGRSLPVRPRFGGAWRALSVGGGRPVTLSAEWDGQVLLPLAVLPSSESAFDNIAPRWSA